MILDGHFSVIWKSAGEFEFTQPDERTDSCVYALAFGKWVEKLKQNIVTDEPTVISINQAKVLLLDRYFDWRNAVPKSHRNRMGEFGHSCIYHVFEQTYEQLRVVELSLMPPLLFLPANSSPSLPGLYLGDFDEE